jgi:hypothetical protein
MRQGLAVYFQCWDTLKLQRQRLKKPCQGIPLAFFFMLEPPDDLCGTSVMTTKYAIAHPLLQGIATTGR